MWILLPQFGINWQMLLYRSKILPVVGVAVFSPVWLHAVLAFRTSLPVARVKGNSASTPWTHCSSSSIPWSTWRNKNSPLKYTSYKGSRPQFLQHDIRSSASSSKKIARFSTPAASTLDDEKDDQEKMSLNDNPQPQLTVAAASLNLIKAIVGSGVLALPSGVAAVSDFPKAYVS